MYLQVSTGIIYNFQTWKFIIKDRKLISENIKKRKLSIINP